MGLFNTGEKNERITVSASTVGVRANKGGYSLHDLWTGGRRNTNGLTSAEALPRGVILYGVKTR